MLITNTTRIKGDSAMGIVLSVFFGLGLVLIAALQKNPSMAQAKLDSYLLGQAATLLERDVMVMAIVGSITLILVAVFWKEFKLLTFDPDFAVSLGFPVRVIDILLTTLVVMAIAIGLQAVGVILIIAVLVAPAAAARQWTDSLAVMVGLAALFGGMSGVGGTLISSLGRGLATGPIIVLCNTAIVLISLMLAPNRGLLWKWTRH
jgi:manganese/zinc/iron transport system permease protein